MYRERGKVNYEYYSILLLFTNNKPARGKLHRSTVEMKYRHQLIEFYFSAIDIRLARLAALAVSYRFFNGR